MQRLGLEFIAPDDSDRSGRLDQPRRRPRRAVHDDRFKDAERPVDDGAQRRRGAPMTTPG